MFKINYIVFIITALLFMACAGTPQRSQEPDWVSDPYSTYNRTAYLATVGYGRDRESAEKTALANLTSIFGQSIDSEASITYTYTEAVEASSPVWSERSDIAQAVRTSAAMDTLIGAEIGNVWRGPDGTWFAVALMDRARASLIYLELIQQNQNTISRLTSLSPAERQSIEGFINYYQAASLADANLVFANVRTVISPGSMAGTNLRTGNDIRLEAAQIARNIPIAVTVNNDRQNRIHSAFSSALSSAGFRTGGGDSRYALQVNFSMEEIEFYNNPYRWVRYVVDANLTDTVSGQILFPYNINDREGHTSLSEAEARAIRAVETRISNEYMQALSMFLSRSL